MLTQARLRELLFYDQDTGVFTWMVTTGCIKVGAIAGSPDAKGYLRIGIDGHTYLAHRLAWLYVTGEWPHAEIDHKFGNVADNRIAKLREASHRQNMANRKSHKNNRSKLKGAHWFAATNRWRSSITRDGKRRHLGWFDAAGAAHAAYNKAAKEAFGQFARTD